MHIQQKNQNTLMLKDTLWGFYIGGAIFIVIAIIVGILGFTQQGSNYLPFVFSLLLLAVGIILPLFGGKRIITMDKNTQQILYKNKRHIYSNEEQYPLQAAEAIVQQLQMPTQSRQDRERNKKKSPYYRYTLKFTNGQTLYISKHKDSLASNVVSTIQGSNVPSHIQTISQFLGIPIQEDKLGQTINKAANAVGAFTRFMGK